MSSGLVHEVATRSMESESWLTPPLLLKALGQFDLDPCAAPSPRPWDTAKNHFTWPELDGLMQPWEGRVFCNPPYGKHTDDWMDRMAGHKNGLALIFARTDTSTWQRVIFPTFHSILFLGGRVKFWKPDGTEGGTAGAPSALISWDEANTLALASSKLKGKLIHA